MKKIKHIGVIAMLLISINLFAQNSLSSQDESSNITGLYKTEGDYVANKLSYEQNCDVAKGSINVDRVFHSSSILIKGNGANQVLSKRDFFGYVDCNHKAFRFYGNEAYEILDAAGFYLYKHTVVKMAKGYDREVMYYFSKDGSDALQLLTIHNLENAFASNIQFCHALESNFHSDKELTEYYKYANGYKIKELFAQSASVK